MNKRLLATFFLVLLLIILCMSSAYGEITLQKSTEFKTNAIEEPKKNESTDLGFPTLEELKTYPLMQISENEEILMPNSIDYSFLYPSPKSQGRQNSCAAFAMAYLKTASYKSYIVESDFMFSPAYIYNQINNGVDEGIYIKEALELITEKGVCKWETMPFSERDYKTRANRLQRNEAEKYKSSGWEFVGGIDEDSDSEELIYKMKYALCSKESVGVIAGIPFFRDDFSKEIYNSSKSYEDVDARHAIAIVGYDDSKNAFKFINSWGNSWGPYNDGYSYISYDMFDSYYDYIDVYRLTDVVEDTDSPEVEDVEIIYSQSLDSIIIEVFGISDPNGVDFIQAGVWHPSDEITKVSWYKDENKDQSIYTLIIPLDDFSNEEGIYNINIYAGDKLGNVGIVFNQSIDVVKDISLELVEDNIIDIDELENLDNANNDEFENIGNENNDSSDLDGNLFDIYNEITDNIFDNSFVYN